MNPFTAVCTGLMISGILLSGSSNVHAQTAEEVLNKADAVYSNAKTYQATFHWEEKLDEREPNKAAKNFLSETELVDTKAIGMTKFAIHGVFEELTIHEQDEEPHGTMEIVDDGAQNFSYLSCLEGYTRRSHVRNMIEWEHSAMMEMIMPRLKPKPGFTYTLLVPTTVNGKPAYVIEAKGEREEPAHGAQFIIVNGKSVEYFPDPKNVTIYVNDLIYIDQTNFHLLQRKSTTTSPTIIVRIVQVIQSEILDAPIPESTFVFKAPNGAKDMTHERPFP